MVTVDIILVIFAIVCFFLSLITLLIQLCLERKYRNEQRKYFLPPQSQQIIIDLNKLQGDSNQPGITVISNDIVESADHHHQRPMNKLTISVINQHVEKIHLERIEQ